MSGNRDREIQVGIAAVTQAAQLCSAVQQSIDLQASEKQDRSPVTVADYGSQALICRALRSAFPQDAIVAEEDATDLRNDEQAAQRQRIQSELAAVGVSASEGELLDWIDFGNHDATADRYWTLDPIDGTKGFLRKEQFAISLALIEGGEIQVGLLACPNLRARDAWDNCRGVVLWAARGGGASLRPLALPEVTPHTVRVSGTRATNASRICESVESGHSAHDWSALVHQRLGTEAEAVRMDSQAKYAVVARGEAEMYLRLPVKADYRERIWDHAGGVLIVQEAGGTVTDIDGKPLDFSRGTTLADNRGVVVTNGLLHTAVLEAIAASAP